MSRLVTFISNPSTCANNHKLLVTRSSYLDVAQTGRKDSNRWSRSERSLTLKYDLQTEVIQGT